MAGSASAASMAAEPTASTDARAAAFAATVVPASFTWAAYPTLKTEDAVPCGQTMRERSDQMRTFPGGRRSIFAVPWPACVDGSEALEMYSVPALWGWVRTGGTVMNCNHSAEWSGVRGMLVPRRHSRR